MSRVEPPSADPEARLLASVVIPAFNAGPALERCVRAVLDQDLPSDEYEIIVVDNGSTPPIAPFPDGRVRIVVEDRPGSYSARNSGVRAARGQVLAFTDADCIPCPGWLRSGLDAVAAGSAIVAGRVELIAATGTPTVTELYELRYGFPQDRYLEEGFGVTANLFVHRSAIDLAGMFDDSLRSGGDREFGQRMSRHGLVTGWAPNALVRHPARRRIGDLLAKARRTEAGTAVMRLRTESQVEVLRGALWLLRPPLRALLRIVREEAAAPLRLRLGLVGLVVLVRVVACWARIVVLIGGRAPR